MLECISSCVKRQGQIEFHQSSQTYPNWTRLFFSTPVSQQGIMVVILYCLLYMLICTCDCGEKQGEREREIWNYDI